MCIDFNLIDSIEADRVFSVKHFENEKSLCDYIELNIKELSNILGISFKTYYREFEISKRKNNLSRSRRCDFAIIYLEDKIHLIEVKNPKYQYDLDSALGQILGYGNAVKKSNREIGSLTILSSMHYTYLFETIDNFNLPVNFLVINKDYYIDSVYKN